MRLVALAVVLAPALASAAPSVGLPLRIWQAPKVKRPTTAALTPISHTIYMNRCAGGCQLSFNGDDDSRTNHSVIAAGNVTMSEWKHGDAVWAAMVKCVRETYSPFNIQVVTDDPGTAPHTEIIVAGTSHQLNPDLQGAGGVSPVIGCDAQEDNHITFMFANDLPQLTVNDPNFYYLCGGVAQETSHAYGLDHELDADDPLTYLQLGSHKTFQDSNPRCGEELANPRECQCGGSTQNTYQFLLSHFGPPNPKEAHLTITSPKDGAWVKPGFPIHFTTDDELSLIGAGLGIDSGAQMTIDSEPFVFSAPIDITPGPHTIKVTAKDFINREISASISVNVLATCTDSCDEPGFACVGGTCIPPASVDGGLGATCANDTECATQSCASDGSNKYCTTSCEMGAANACPSGFDCIAAGDGGVCWPGGDDGGCSTGGNGSVFALGAIGVGLVLRRRGK